MKNQCDCTAYCGSDPGIHDGTVEPCECWHRSQRYKRLVASAERMLSALKAYKAGHESIEWVDDFCWDGLEEAEEIIKFVEGK